MSEILYAYASGTGNNGSAFGGLNANTPWYNLTIGLAMLIGDDLVFGALVRNADRLGDAFKQIYDRRAAELKGRRVDGLFESG